ncbi:MAG: hypothetical protein U9Q92_04380, partial [archaeon]|nr:hypothetical protein [archaeon]
VGIKKSVYGDTKGLFPIHEVSPSRVDVYQGVVLSVADALNNKQQETGLPNQYGQELTPEAFKQSIFEEVYVQESI